MKTIIACTDFSPNATNAVQYAAAFAAAANARLVLFHHFTYPVQATDLPDAYPAVFVDELEDNADRQIKHLQTELARSYKIDIDYKVRSLSLASDLEEVVAEEQAALVVMGIQGQSAVLNALFGNVTSAAIRRSNLPLLVIPQGVVFHPVKKILFPYDGQSLPQPETLQPLRDLAIAFDAYVEVFTLFDLQKTPELVPGSTHPAAKNAIETFLQGTRHGYSAENEENVDKGILYEAARSSADLVAMITHQHSFWSTLLNQSDTQRVAASILLPLLVLGERSQQMVEDEVHSAGASR